MGDRYVVLGSGRQGVSAAYDLGRFGHADEIVMADIDGEAARRAASRLAALLGREVARPVQVDVRDLRAVAALLDGADACLGATHFDVNVALTRLAIRAKTHLVDFGGNTGVVREQIALSSEAARAGVTVVPDCGMGPGLNISLAVHAMSLVERPREVRIWDGGLPQDPQPPWRYASTFHVAGLTNEFDGDAVFLRGGVRTSVPCFEDVEEFDFAPVGRVEAFVTSGGLSTAPWTFEGTLERLENKTIRYPGFAAQFRAFRDLGLFRLDAVEAGGVRVVPRELFHALLEPQLRRPEVRDICLMRVRCDGESDGRPARATIELVDRYDEATGLTAMQRLTGWHASIMLIAAVEGRVPPGVIPVERALAGKVVTDEARRRGLAITDHLD
jgi:lysine 6-dehydrogenase